MKTLLLGELHFLHALLRQQEERTAPLCLFLEPAWLLLCALTRSSASVRHSINLYYVTFVFNIAISYTFHNCVLNYCLFP